MKKQMARRATQGKATANNTTPPASASHANHAAAAGRDGVSSIREQDAAQLRVSRIGWDIPRQQVTCDVRVWQFEKLDEGRLFFACGKGVPVT